MDEKKVREEEYLEFPWGIEDTIENLRELKSILQKRVREEDCDGKGTQDAFELGFDFDRAIEALEKQLPKKPIDKSCAKDNDTIYGYVGICPSCNDIVDDSMIVCDCTQVLDWSE